MGEGRGCSSGGPGTGIPAFLGLGADYPRPTEVWVGTTEATSKGDAVTRQIFFFRDPPWGEA